MRIIFNVHSPKKLSESTTLKIDFAEVSQKISAKDQAVADDLKISQGVRSPIDIYMRDNPDVNSREDAMSYLLGFPEVEKLEKQNSRVSRYLKYRNEKDEILREKKIIRKNPVLKKFVTYKRIFRQKLRAFLEDPLKFMRKKDEDFFSQEQNFFDQDFAQ